MMTCSLPGVSYDSNSLRLGGGMLNVSADFTSQYLNDMPSVWTTMRLSSSVAGTKQKVTRRTITSPALTVS